MTTFTLWTADDVAHAIGSTPGKVRRMAAKDGMPSIVLPGGDRRFDPVDVRKWLDTKKTNREGDAA